MIRIDLSLRTLLTILYFANARTHSAQRAAAAASPDEEPFAPSQGAAPVADNGRARAGPAG